MRFWQLLLWLTLGVLIVVGIAPLLKMFLLTLLSWDHAISLDILKETTLLSTLLFALGVAFFATTLGTLLALLFAKTDIPFVAIWMTLLGLPLLLPSDIVALGWIDLLLPFDTLREYLESYGGAFWIETTIYMPIAMLLGYFYLRRIPSQIEYAALLYIDESRMVRTIDLPLLRPMLLLSFLIIVLLSLGEFAVPNALHIRLYSVELFTRFSALYDFEATLVMSLPLLLIAAVAIWIEQAAANQNHFTKLHSRSYRIQLSPSLKRSLLLGVGILVVLITLLPLFGIASSIDSLTQLWQGFTHILTPVAHSLLYAVLGGAFLTFTGFVAAVTHRYHPSKLTRFEEQIMLFFFILPSIVIAVALIGFYNTALTDWVYASAFMLLFGYMAKYLILPTKALQIALDQIPKSLSQAALIHGATPIKMLCFIIVPLLRRQLVAALLLGTLFCLRESTLSMLLLPAGEATFPLYLATHAANGASGVIAAMALWMVFVVFFVTVTFVRLAAKFSRSLDAAI